MVTYDAWDYIQYLTDTYGPVARVHGFFGVRISAQARGPHCLTS